jgi:hypothetical protein
MLFIARVHLNFELRVFRSLFSRKEPVPASIAGQPGAVTPSDRLNALDRKRALLRWRDQQELRVESLLRQNLPGLKQEVWDWITALPTGKFFFKQGSWLKEVAENVVEPWVKVQTVDILRVASSEGIAVVSQRGGIYESDHALEGDENLQQVTDLAGSLGPIAAGFIAIPSTISASVSSAGGILGLFGASAIFWPAAILGVTLIGGAFVFGGSRLKSYRERANRRAYDKICSHLDSMILRGSEEKPSLSQALQEVIRTTASEQLGASA